jgi:hypothetical protein
MIGFKRLNKVNLNEENDDIYIISKVRRRKYDWPLDNDEVRDAEWDTTRDEPKKREYEDEYQMNRIKYMTSGRIHRLLSKDHLLMRFTDED